MYKVKLDLPSSFYEGEERDGYYVSPEMKKVWAVELEMLVELLRVCKKHNIKVFADGGTMLGAVRHGGFIPWDDDIDVMMPRDEYIKLCAIAEQEFKEPFFFQTEYTDIGSMRGHAQLRNSETTAILQSEIDKKYSFNQGIFLDIFPLDNVIEDEKLYEKQAKRAKWYKRIAHGAAWVTTRYVKNDTDTFWGKLKDFVHPIAAIIIRKTKMEHFFYKKFEKECMRYNNVETTCFSNFGLGYQKIRWRIKEDYEELIEVPFETIMIPIPKGYERQLTRSYKNWREFKIVKSVHGSVMFDTEKKYSEYIK